jgi:hypothetical protein
MTNINDIDFLYSNGCSWTAGNGIQDDPALSHLPLNNRWDYLLKKSWPAVLSDNLKCDFRNDALGAGSNKRMVRTTIDFLTTYPKERYNKLLVVLGWTTVDRNEIYLSDGFSKEGWCMFNATQSVSSHRPPFRPNFDDDFLKEVDAWQKKYVESYFSDEANYTYFFQEMYLMSNLLENLGIKYIFFSSLPWNHYTFEKIKPKYIDKINLLDKENILNVNKPNYHGVMSLFVEQNCLPMAKDHHTMIEGHKMWGEHLFDVTRRIYG